MRRARPGGSCRSSSSSPALLDSSFGRSPNRRGFLAESLADLDGSLRALGRGSSSAAAIRSTKWRCSNRTPCSSPTTRARTRSGANGGSRARFELHLHPATTVVPFDDLKTYRVFTPYHRAWSSVPWRASRSRRLSPIPASRASRCPRLPRAGRRTAPAEASLPARETLERWLAQAAAYDPNDLARRPRASARTSTSAACRRSSARRAAARAQPGCASSAGATSTRSSCARSPERRVRTSTTGRTPAAMPARRSRPGAAGTPATPSWTPACGSSRSRAGCTTAPGSSRRPSSSRISASTGGTVPTTSSGCCSMATSRRTAATGSGSPARASTTRRAAGCSTRRCRRTAATPPAPTFAATSPSSPTSTRPRFTSRGRSAAPPGYPEPIVDHGEIASRRRRGELPTLF